MSYDPYADYRRRQAEIQKQESQRFWDRTMRDLHAQSNPTPATPPGDTATGVVGLVGSALGWTGYWILSPPNQGLAWVLGFVSNLVLVIVVAPRTLLVAGVLVGILGVWVEFFAA